MPGPPPLSSLCPFPLGWCLKPKTDTWDTKKGVTGGHSKTLSLGSDHITAAESVSHSFLRRTPVVSRSLIVNKVRVQPLTRFHGSFPWLLSHTSLRFFCLPFLSDTWKGSAYANVKHVKGQVWSCKGKLSTKEGNCFLHDLSANGGLARI